MPVERPLILLVDDDSASGTLLEEALAQTDCQVARVNASSPALARFGARQPALFIISLSLPTPATWKLLRDLRLSAEAPILLVAKAANEEDCVAGLENGADDVVAKPASPQLVLAHARALMRRAGQPPKLLVCGPLALDPRDQQVTLDGARLLLTNREYALLEMLARNPGRAVSRSELLARCWQVNDSGVGRVVDVYMVSLRRKLGKQRNLISTVRGIGYRLNGP